MIQVLKSWDVNDEVYYIALNNGLPKHKHLIKYYYWEPDCRKNIRYNLYKENKKINDDNIVRSLAK